MKFEGQCFRGHDPTWSFSPISGGGAAKAGGRFNRKGEPTLYLSLAIVTAINECMQGLTQRLQPLTICEYEVDCEPIADLRTDVGRDALGVEINDLACPWLTYQRTGKEAPSWLVTDKLKGEGYAGMLVPSFAFGARADDFNLILWRWGPDLPTKVMVFDPSGRLPKNQLSWT